MNQTNIKRQKLLIVTNWLKQGGGAENITVKIANAACKYDFAVDMLVMMREYNDLAKIVDTSVGINYLSDTLSLPSYIKLYFYILRCHSDTILFATNHRIAIVLLMMRFLSFSKNKIIARNISNLSILMKDKPKFYIWILKKLYARVDLLIAQSEGMKEDLIGNYHFSNEKIEILYNPIEFDHNVPSKSNRTNEPIKILFVGRLAKEKGFQYIFEGLEFLKEKNIDFILQIVGRGEQEDFLKQEVQKLGLEEKIMFMGFHSDVSSFYKTSDLLILCSEYEGFPNVLLEANAYGLPIVSCDTPFGPSEIIINGKNGFLCPYQDGKSLGETIVRCIEYPWNAEKIQQSIARFSNKNFEQKLMSILRDMNE